MQLNDAHVTTCGQCGRETITLYRKSNHSYDIHAVPVCPRCEPQFDAMRELSYVPCPTFGCPYFVLYGEPIGCDVCVDRLIGEALIVAQADEANAAMFAHAHALAEAYRAEEVITMDPKHARGYRELNNTFPRFIGRKSKAVLRRSMGEFVCMAMIVLTGLLILALGR